MSLLDGMTVVITGAGQGIGRVLSQGLAASGATVAAADLDLDNAEETCARVRAAGGKAEACLVDVADGASCDAMAAWAEERFGVVDGLVNNAAIFSSLELRPFWEIPDGEWDRVLAVNLSGVMRATRALLPALRRSAAAAVVNISSGTVWSGRANYAHYVSSKAGVVGLTRAMARELGEVPIRVNAITPGMIVTEVPRAASGEAGRVAAMGNQAMKRRGAPDDLVGPIAFLLSGLSAHMTGQTLSVDGGSNLR